MKQIWEDDFNNLYKDFEDIQQHCRYLESENKELQKKAELGEHYKHLYSELKKQKDDVVEYIKTTTLIDYDNDEVDMLKDTYVGEDLLRMLGEIE